MKSLRIYHFKCFTPHDRHGRELADEWVSERTLGVAVYAGQSVLDISEIWQRESGRELIAID